MRTFLAIATKENGSTGISGAPESTSTRTPTMVAACPSSCGRTESAGDPELPQEGARTAKIRLPSSTVGGSLQGPLNGTQNPWMSWITSLVSRYRNGGDQRHWDILVNHENVDLLGPIHARIGVGTSGFRCFYGCPRSARFALAKLHTTEIYTHVVIAKLIEVHRLTHPAEMPEASA